MTISNGDLTQTLNVKGVSEITLNVIPQKEVVAEPEVFLPAPAVTRAKEEAPVVQKPKPSIPKVVQKKVPAVSVASGYSMASSGSSSNTSVVKSGRPMTRRIDETPDHGLNMPRVIRGGIDGQYNRQKKMESQEEPPVISAENIFVPMDDIKRV